MTSLAQKAELPAPVRLAGASRAEVSRALAEIGVPERELKMRGSQLWHWIYHRGAREFSAMRNIARPLLERLGESFTLDRPRSWPSRFPPTARASGSCASPPVTASTRAPRSNASISLNRDRGTLCVSSQVGCTLNCTFCHTGTQPLVRNLTAAEIVRPGPGRPRPARRLSRRRSADRRACTQRRRRTRGVQHRLHGDGRAALQFRRRCATRSRF